MEPSNKLTIASLGEGWSDKDNIMLHACFQLFIDCIEKEKLFEKTDWSYNKEYSEAKEELDNLYFWWKQRLNDEKINKFDPIWTEGQHDKDTEMLIRLVKKRKYLWT